MKSPEDMSISLLASDENNHHRKTMLRLYDGEEVRGSDLLKLGLYLVTEVLRRNETPSFMRGFFSERLTEARSLATKYNALLQCWPGVTPPSMHMIQEQKKALDLLGLLVQHSPQDPEPRFDTSGDI